MAHSHPLLRGAIFASFVLAACAAPESSSPSSSSSELASAATAALNPSVTAPTLKLGHPHLLPFRPRNAQVNPSPKAGTGNLVYYGGHVISNVKVYAVFWGSQVSTTTTSQIGGFFKAVTNSDYMDWLSEYNTTVNAQDGSAGTQQKIGRGTYAGEITITPSTSATTIDDSQIAQELGAQIQAGKLPPPDNNTIFMTFFPPGVTITQGQSQSCVSGGFCAYHSAFQQGSQDVFYGVMPDPGGGCAQGCGSADPFSNLTISTSHELTEAVTDGEVGLATGSSLGKPLAWYDSSNGEIGDICAGSAQTASLPNPSGGSPATYTAQLEWSNGAASCIQRNTATNDFSLAFSTLSNSVSSGGSTTVQLSTTKTAGSPGSISLALANLPNGVTGSISPTSVSAGGTATVTLNVGAGASASVDNVIVVEATAGSVVHTASTLLTIKPPPPSDFSLSLNPTTVSLGAGGSAQLTLSTAVLNGSPGALSLSVTGLPSGITGSFQANSVAAGQGTTLTLNADASAQLGSTSFQVVAASAATSHQATATVTVLAGPSISFVTPSDGSTVQGQVNLQVQTVNASSSASITVQLDGQNLFTGQGTSLNQVWDTSQASNGQHTLKATVTDGSQPASNATISVTVFNPLSVSITSPQTGATLTGNAAKITAAVTTSGVTLSTIEIDMDDFPIGTGSASPYTATVDTTQLGTGTHTLQAKAVDASGNVATSPVMQVNIHNAPPTNPNPNPGTNPGTNPAPKPASCGCTSASPTQNVAFLLIGLVLVAGRLSRARRSLLGR